MATVTTTESALSADVSDSVTATTPPGLCTDDSDSSTDDLMLLLMATPRPCDPVNGSVRPVHILIFNHELIHPHQENHIPDIQINELRRQYLHGDPKFDLSPEPMQKLTQSLQYRLLMYDLCQGYLKVLSLEAFSGCYPPFGYRLWRSSTTHLKRTCAEGAMMEIRLAKIFPKPKSHMDGRRYDKPMQYLAAAYANANFLCVEVQHHLEHHREALEELKSRVFSSNPDDQALNHEPERISDAENPESNEQGLTIRHTDSD